MRKTLTAVALTSTLLGGIAATAPAASAAPLAAPVSVTAQGGDQAGAGDDKSGLWGLLGLIGLAGLIKRKVNDDAPSARR